MERLVWIVLPEPKARIMHPQSSAMIFHIALCPMLIELNVC